jgi:hypothetical protein
MVHGYSKYSSSRNGRPMRCDNRGTRTAAPVSNLLSSVTCLESHLTCLSRRWYFNARRTWTIERRDCRDFFEILATGGRLRCIRSKLERRRCDHPEADVMCVSASIKRTGIHFPTPNGARASQSITGVTRLANFRDIPHHTLNASSLPPSSQFWRKLSHL